MPFKIQQPGTGLFWSGHDGRIRLLSEGSTYEIDDDGHIRNVDTGLYVRHSYWILFEHPLGAPGHDFKWTIEDSGRIRNDYDGPYYVNPDGDSLRITPALGPKTVWNIITSEEDDVPVNRAAALIEEALNAKASCGCECGCGPDCQGCDCECGCPKAPVETPVETPEVPVEASVEVTEPAE